MIEALLVLGVIVGITVAILFAMSLAHEAIEFTVAYFVVPVDPPGLVRLREMLERQREEGQVGETAVAQGDPPPPEIVAVPGGIAA